MTKTVSELVAEGREAKQRLLDARADAAMARADHALAKAKASRLRAELMQKLEAARRIDPSHPLIAEIEGYLRQRKARR